MNRVLDKKIGLYWSLIIDVVVKKAASDAVFTISFELKNKDNNTGQTVMSKNSLVMYVKSISLIFYKTMLSMLSFQSSLQFFSMLSTIHKKP